MIYCLYNDQLDMNNFISVIFKKTVTEDSADVVTIGKKGSDGINGASQNRSYRIFPEPGQKVHKSCCRNYCKPQIVQRAVKKDEDDTMSPKRSLTRCTGKSFHSNCATEVVYEADDNREKPKDVFKVKKVETKDMVFDVYSNKR